MAIIKGYDREVQAQNIGSQYVDGGNVQGAFGEDVARAGMNLADAGFNAMVTIDKIAEEQDKQKAVKLKNAIYQEWEKPNLYSQEGYFNQLGQNASGRSGEVLQSYNEFIKNKSEELGLTSARGQRYINELLSRTSERISRDVLSHDLKQTQEVTKNDALLLIQNVTQQGINDRNNVEGINRCIADVTVATQNYATNSNMDETQTKLLVKSNVSSALSSIITSCVSEGSLQAKVLFDKYKDYLTPDAQVKLGDAVDNLNKKYEAKSLANDLIQNSATLEEALKKADAIENIELSENVSSQIRSKISQQESAKNYAERQANEQFYNNVLIKVQNGQPLSYTDIPEGMDAQSTLSAMEFVNKNGNPNTDDEVWNILYDMQVNNAQEFAKEDLNKYRGYLSDGEYKQFLKSQEEIKKGDYYSTIKDDDKMIQEALKTIGLRSDGKRKSAFSEIRSLVREYETRKGRKISDTELMNITNSLGYEGANGVQTYKLLEKGMKARTEFIRAVINDFAYYQKKHNGELPPDAEKFKIIQSRINKKVEENKNTALNVINNSGYLNKTIQNINNVVAKPHEQKVLTYFADSQVPALSQQLGLKLTITERVRDKSSKYYKEGSHHNTGYAADVSMSEHTVKNRIRIFERLLQLPTTKALGTSDAAVLSYFKGTRYAYKLVDEREYDRKNNTNHVNHVHVTLINPTVKVSSSATGKTFSK